MVYIYTEMTVMSITIVTPFAAAVAIVSMYISRGEYLVVERWVTVRCPRLQLALAAALLALLLLCR
jgi:hypothetical protein